MDTQGDPHPGVRSATPPDVVPWRPLVGVDARLQRQMKLQAPGHRTVLTLAARDWCLQVTGF
jgi:hypothetical protein